MKKLVTAILILFLSLSVWAQEPATPGTYIGDLKISSTLFFPHKLESLKDLKGKAVLIDFWSSKCMSCFRAFPEMDALKSKFKDDLVFFYATPQPRKEVEDFFKRRPEFLKYNISFITDAGKLEKLFPHSSIPHFVWIGKDGKVKAITDHRPVNEQNLRKLVSAGTLSLPAKRSFAGFTGEAPFLEESAFQAEVIRSSMISGNVDGLPASKGFTRLPNGVEKLFALNQTLSSLYFYAYTPDHSMQFTENGRLLRLQLRDSTRFFDMTEPARTPRRFCFELIAQMDTPSRTNAPMMRKMQRELDHHFGLRSKLRVVETDCYVVTKGVGFKPAQNSKGSVEEGFGYVKMISAKPQLVTAYVKDNFISDVPLLIEGFTNERIDLTLAEKYTDINVLRSDLLKAGLDISLKRRSVQMLFVTD
ncbi:MAG: TlpA family protein disulfide reductase [Sphingobacteriales bacterium]|nr:MAG: TlpA family protein disulfide reductase [Sphingobacteriales bacterium]